MEALDDEALEAGYEDIFEEIAPGQHAHMDTDAVGSSTAAGIGGGGGGY